MTNMGWLPFDVTKTLLILLCAKLPSRLYNWLPELGKHLCSYLLYFLDFYDLTEAVWCGFEGLQCDEVHSYIKALINVSPVILRLFACDAALWVLWIYTSVVAQVQLFLARHISVYINCICMQGVFYKFNLGGGSCYIVPIIDIYVHFLQNVVLFL